MMPLWVLDFLVTVFMSCQIKYRQMYDQEMKGKASAEAAVAESIHARENAENFSQVRTMQLLDYYCLKHTFLCYCYSREYTCAHLHSNA